MKSLLKLSANTLTNLIFNDKIHYNNIEYLDFKTYGMIYKKIYNKDFDNWKKKIFPTLIEIESTLWNSVKIWGPNFSGNTFNMHYHDILITDLYANTQTIYQFHTPYWELYFERANKFLNDKK